MTKATRVGAGGQVEHFQPASRDVDQAIAACEVFDPVTGVIRSDLVAAFDGVRLQTGEVLMREGEAADALYVVRHGRLRTTVEGHDGVAREIGQVGKSEVVGEMALITDEPRSATVTAMRDSELYRLPAEAFTEITSTHPDLLRPFAGVVVARLRKALTRPPKPSLPATIVLLPTPGASADDLAQDIVGALENLEAVIVRPGDAQGRDNLAAWLLDLENAVDVSLLVADEDPTNWTRQCLRHADRVLLLANEGRPASLTPVERDDACVSRMQELPVELVMQYSTRPSSSAWLAQRDLAAHHNLRAGSVTDIGRLVRRLAGLASVVVLGGGGARGFAHLGVLRALIEADIPIDAVVGTSAGALVGGGYAYTGDIDITEQALLDWFSQVKWRRDINPPTLALLTGRLMTEAFRSHFGDARIEDLTFDFTAVSCDLTAAEPYVHVDGPLWQAIRASAAVPGLFPPVALNGRLLVDGGVVANLPIAQARQRHTGANVIAVDVGDPIGIEPGDLDGSGIVNGWRRARRPSSGPTLPRLLMRLTELGRSDVGEKADLLIAPDVTGFGLTDTKPAPAIIERGYESAVDTLASLSRTRQYALFNKLLK